VGTTKGRDSTFGFHLAEPGVIGRHDDIASQHHFDSDRETDPLHRRDDRLAAPAFQRERIDVARLDIGILSLWSKEFRHIQPGREIRAFGAEYPDPVIVRSVEKRHRIRHLRHHLRTERVLLRHVVDDDLEDVPVHLGADLADLGFRLVHLLVSELLPGDCAATRRFIPSTGVQPITLCQPAWNGRRNTGYKTFG
jgi:hypothetical protein